MGGFVEQMWEFAVRKSHDGEKLSPTDLAIFEDAIQVKNELDGYHGRAVFDDRNIEDILSILSFNVLGGVRSDREKLNRMNRAIAKTIDLCCSVTHPGVPAEGSKWSVQSSGPEMYRLFWKSLFSRSISPEDFPTIITFNYDLVLECALLQTLIGTHYNIHENRLPFEALSLRYHHDRVPDHNFVVSYQNYERDFKTIPGTRMHRVGEGSWNGKVDVDMLKLHGSLNFVKKRVKYDEAGYNIARPLEDPQILPPISNKMSGDMSDKIWSVALKRLREAKNVVVVGYSLPKTDIYMQYFLKAAFGPNVDLNKISVFDPVLHSGSPENQEMRSRYQDCFPPQLHSRIDFNPAPNAARRDTEKGTAEHFVEALENSANQ